MTTDRVHTILLFLITVVFGLPLAARAEAPDLSRVLLKSTARIEVTKADGPHAGTGFFFFLKHPDGEQSVPLLITCKHLLAGAQSGGIFLSIKSADEKKEDIQVRRVAFEDTQSAWVPHPQQDVDLVAMPLAPLFRKLQETKEMVDLTPLAPALLPDEETLRDISLFSEVKIVGYPIGIWDQKTNLPLFRRGMFASDPLQDFQGKPVFLIDAAILPGSSGSPVLIADEGSYASKGGLSFGRRVFFVGVVFATPLMQAKGQIEFRPLPTAFDAVSLTPVPTNLGVVLKASLLADFLKIFGVPEKEEANKSVEPTPTR